MTLERRGLYGTDVLNQPILNNFARVRRAPSSSSSLRLQ
jgi:hypothetical protein